MDSVNDSFMGLDAVQLLKAGSLTGSDIELEQLDSLFSSQDSVDEVLAS